MTTAERTPTEIIAEQRVHGVQVAYRAEYFIKALADAGFVICRMPGGVHAGHCPTCGCEPVEGTPQ